MPVDVRHDAATQRFVAEIDGQRAECDYRLYEHDGEVMFSHTYVPPALRGQGVAAELVRVALDWARARPEGHARVQLRAPLHAGPPRDARPDGRGVAR